jgi:hypothetical protein
MQSFDGYSAERDCIAIPGLKSPVVAVHSNIAGGPFVACDARH